MVQSAKILVVDDESGVRFYLQDALENEGYQVVAVDSGEAALAVIAAQAFHLALLDLKMPGIGGMEVLKTLAAESPDTAIIVLTAHASIETSVEALRWGAHDYLFKPFKTGELLESVRTGLLKQQRTTRQKNLLSQLEHSLTRNLEEIRAAVVHPQGAEEREPERQIAMPSSRRLHIDKIRHEITLDACVLELSPTEFDFLVCLVKDAPRVLSAQEIVRQVQGYETEPWEARDMVRYHVYRIRQKIEAATGESDVIQTVRGVGYAVNEDFL